MLQSKASQRAGHDLVTEELRNCSLAELEKTVLFGKKFI